MENFRLFYKFCEKEGVFEEEERKNSILKENKKKNGIRDIGQTKRRENSSPRKIKVITPY